MVLLAVLCTPWPAAAQAAAPGCAATPVESDALAVAVGRLQQSRIVRGDPTSWLVPPVSITRAEVAGALVRAMGREAEALARKGEPAFPDTAAHWSSGFVALLKAEGILRGRGDGSFGPDYKATLGELEIMLARLLRLGAAPTPEAAAAALQRGGVALPAGCAAGAFVSPQRFYLLLDGALQTPIYRRLGIEAPPPGPACTTQEACIQQLKEALRRLGPTNIIGPFEPGLTFPHETFTRAKAARMLVILLGLQAEAAGHQAEAAGHEAEGTGHQAAAAFPDTAGHWAAGDVALLKDVGVVRGEGDGLFHPDWKLRAGEGEILLARLLRLGSDLTPAQADAALQASGIRWAWDRGSPTAFETYDHFLPLLDEALRTPFYARFPAASP